MGAWLDDVVMWCGGGGKNARPSLPVNPNPILTPPNIAPLGLHDTAAQYYALLTLHLKSQKATLARTSLVTCLTSFHLGT